MYQGGLLGVKAYPRMSSEDFTLRKVLYKIRAVAANRILGTITHVSTHDSVAALTFDDGPNPEYTPRLLDILDKYQARATFFMVGEVAQRHRWLVKRVSQAGHAIGNHSWDHASFPLLTGRDRRAQIRACHKAIAPYGQRIFRPPYGDQTVGSYLDALWMGHKVVTWNVVAEDWLDHDSDWIADNLAGRVRPGSVILLHDALYDTIEERYTDRQPMFEAVKMLLERLGDQFRFVTIPELFRHGRPQRIYWYKKSDPDWLNTLTKRGGEARLYSDI